MAHGASAVVAYNDDVAALVVGAAVRHGIAVSDQLAVVGHDSTPIAELFVPLPHVDQRRHRRAALALTAAAGAPAPEAARRPTQFSFDAILPSRGVHADNKECCQTSNFPPVVTEKALINRAFSLAVPVGFEFSTSHGRY